MIKKVTALLIGVISLSSQTLISQTSETPLFKFGTDDVMKSEFLQVYEKNNTGKQSSYSEESLREYLDLYINFRLRVKEAEEFGLDTVKVLLQELGTYRDQLAKSYMTDKDEIALLVEEAWKRSLEEIRASHILIRVGENANPKDTMIAYKKAKSIRKRVMSGGDFKSIAMELSEDPSAKDNGGELGYFTSLRMIYPFENAAFNTKPGSVSNPVRTKFGYHLLKIHDRRENQGQIRTAHIYVRTSRNDTPEKQTKAEDKIKKVHGLLIAGESFEDLIPKYSEDKSTKNKAGELPWFGTMSPQRMVFEFENAAFLLAKDGDISKPVQTPYGWHIIKRLEIKTDNRTFEEAKDELERRVKRDPRAAVASKAVLRRIQIEYNFKESKKVKGKLFANIDSSLLQGKWKAESARNPTKTLFELDDKEFTVGQFANFLAETQRPLKVKNLAKVTATMYNNYVYKVCFEYEESRLEMKYPDFKSLMKEYRDGILLFELMDRKVWSKALSDTTGLLAYYENNKHKYMWGDRIRVIIYKCVNDDIAKKVRKLLNSKLSDKEILEKINKDQIRQVSVEEGMYEKGQNNVTDQIIWKMGISSSIKMEDDRTAIARVTGLLDAQPKLLHEAKGYVVADYQTFLEKEWIKLLREKYPVKVNEDVFKSLLADH